MSIQTHLSNVDSINLGSFYTPDCITEIAYEMLARFLDSSHLTKDLTLLDTSCGYGNFLKIPQGYKHLQFSQIIGADIDKKAIEIARRDFIGFPKKALFFHKNTLHHLNRESFQIPQTNQLIIVGNPPYNDKTSIVQKYLKNQSFEIEHNLAHRDIGISFLRSFNVLKADFICVLHPLSYLIKETNFKALKDFTKNYQLLDSRIVSSEIFCPKSSGHFPIVVALYHRQKQGMDYNFIKNYLFKTLDNKEFRLRDFDFISKYIDKYPNRKRILNSEIKKMFYTMRDVNALRRSKTFIDKDCANAVYVTQEKYSLYCYVDVFKEVISHIPYYLGNCDIMIDYENFKGLESEFVEASESKTLNITIMKYFKDLLGAHYKN